MACRVEVWLTSYEAEQQISQANVGSVGADVDMTITQS